MDHQHAVVWIDHREAHILRFGLTGTKRQVLQSRIHATHLHHKANTIGDGRTSADVELFERVSDALQGISAILIAGPAAAKLGLKRYISKEHPGLMHAIKGIETIDHPSEGELLAYARRYFKNADRMLP